MAVNGTNYGTIYLIQPAELVGTDRYKIGCSAKNDLERPRKGYRKGSRFIYIMECSNPFEVERQIKKKFNSLFKLIAGNEFFEGKELPGAPHYKYYGAAKDLPGVRELFAEVENSAEQNRQKR